MARLRTGLALALVLFGSIALAYPVLAYNLNGDRGRRLTAAVELALSRPAPASAERDRGPSTSTAGSGARAASPGQGGERAERANADGSSPGGSSGGSDEAPVGGRPILEVPAPKNGQALGIVQIPSISLRTVFLEGVSESSLMVGPGHLPWTSMPGTGGVSVIAAHRDLHFADLHDVDYGDQIWLQLTSGTTTYKVVDVQVTSPGDGAIYAASDPRHPTVLRLLTCWPPAFAGPAPDRLVISAVPLQGDVAPPALPSPEPSPDPRSADRPGRATEDSGAGGSDAEGSADRAGARAKPGAVLPSAPEAGVTEVLPMVGAAGVGLSSLAAFAGAQGRRRRGWFFLFLAGALVLDAVLAVGLMA